MKWPYKKRPLEQQHMAHDGRRWVVELNAIGLSQLGKLPDNPGVIAFATSVRATRVAAGNRAEVNGDLGQVQTIGIHHDWIWEIDERAKYVVLVWPFHAPKTWQIVGYLLREDADGFKNDGKTVIPWSEFKPFILRKTGSTHNSTSLYSAPPSSDNGRLQETAAN